MTDTLHRLMQRLDERQHVLASLDAYYAGTQPLAFLAPEARQALGTRFGRMASNIPRLAVTSLAERLRITGFRAAGTPSPELWASWVRNDLDQLSGVAHREALALGRSYVVVWAGTDRRAQVSVESAHQMSTLTDPGTRRTLAAIKRWEAPDPANPAGMLTHAVLYQPDQITRYVANAPGATAPAFRTVDTIRNPLGVVPVVVLRNGDRLLDDGVSEMADLIPLTDALNKALADMLVASEYFARPRRTATGIELVEEPVIDESTGLPVIGPDGQPVTEEVNPFPEGHRMMIAEQPDARFGQLPAADLAAYEAAVRVILGQIMAVSALPAHYVGVFTSNPTSADATRAAEASLSARAEARQHTFGRAWEQVARLMVAVETGTDPANVETAVTWADPATRSVAQEADAIVKLHAAGILPTSIALARLGYTEDEITTIRDARTADAIPAPREEATS